MCGFFGIIYSDDRREMGEVLFKAGKRLSYRGYDTSGVGVVDGSGNVEIRKDVGKIEEVAEKHRFAELSGKKGIIQLRWATFGVPSVRNAQPHKDCTGEFLGAHNGNIINTPALRMRLKSSGHKLMGENDGEVILHVIEDYYKITGDMVQAIVQGTKDLEGDFACIITKRDEDRMFVVKKGSSLFLGKGDGYYCASSDLASILDHTKQILTLSDGEFVEFGTDYFIVRDLDTGEIIEKNLEEIDLDIGTVEKGSFPHFMLKEIYESPQKAHSLIGLMSGNVVYDEGVDLINASPRVFITGAGTSYHSALLGTYYFSRISGKLLNISFASDFREFYAPVLEDDDLLIAVSQSGETKDVKNVCDVFREKTEGKIISVVNNLGSTIALLSDLVLPIASDIEISVPATKTFVNQTILFLNMAVLSAKKKMLNVPTIPFEKIPWILEKSIEISEEYVDNVIQAVDRFNEFYILGYGLTYPAALEGALKVKEVVYVHAEGMYSGEFKHGPLSIVHQDYPVFFVSTIEDKFFVLSHIQEVKTRLGKVITVAPEDPELEEVSDIFIPLPTDNPYLVPVSATIFFQLLAYHLGVNRGIDPDFPKNISKTITVD